MMGLRQRWLEHRRNRKSPRPAIVIQTIEAQWPEGYVPLSKRDPERYEEQRAKILAALAKDSVPYYTIPSIDGHTNLPDHIDPEAYSESAQSALALARRFSEGHGMSCEPECDGTDRYCKCSTLGPCWHHR